MSKHDYPQAEICSTCKGGCCKHYPGLFWPEQFLTTSSIVKALRKNICRVDWWEGKHTSGISSPFFLRAPQKTELKGYKHAGWGGRCLLLNEEGCTLPREERPMGCKCVIPKENMQCETIKKSEQVGYWDTEEHQAKIKAALKILEEKQ